MFAEKTNYQLLSELVSNQSKVEEILNHYSHNFLMITRASFEDLKKLGLSQKEAIRMVACLELFKRAYTQTNVRKISNSNDAYVIFKDLSFSRVEIFSVIFLDRANNVLSHKKMFQGGISETAVDIRIILKSAIDLGSTSFIVGHNHPSGNLTASSADTNLCNQIKNAGKLLQISLLDFLIIGNNEYLSFQDEGLLKFQKID
jgi:DNA repair protein RadC